MVFGDEDGHCRSYSCSARGGLDGVDFPRFERRPIRDMPRLLKSREYAQSLRDYRVGAKRP